jgi:hypothetical protein
MDAEPRRRFRRWLIERDGGECNAVFGLIRSDVLARSALIGKYMASDVVLLGELTLWGKLAKIPERLFMRRDHPNTSGRANDGPEAILEWFDTSKKGRIHTPLWRWSWEYSKAIARVPLGSVERMACFKLLARWLIMIRPKLKRELMRATKKAIGRGAVLP